MTDSGQTPVTRRAFLKTAAAAAVVGPLLAGAPGAMAQSPARGATKVLDFQTAADDTCGQFLG